MQRFISCRPPSSALTSASVSGFDPNRIVGSYVESRSADVYVGACFGNSQLGLAGKEGTMAWKITSGEINGVSLAGQSVVAVDPGEFHDRRQLLELPADAFGAHLRHAGDARAA